MAREWYVALTFHFFLWFRFNTFMSLAETKLSILFRVLKSKTLTNSIVRLRKRVTIWMTNDCVNYLHESMFIMIFWTSCKCLNVFVTSAQWIYFPMWWKMCRCRTIFDFFIFSDHPFCGGVWRLFIPQLE